jgi:hypothetical protein
MPDLKIVLGKLQAMKARRETALAEAGAQARSELGPLTQLLHDFSGPLQEVADLGPGGERDEARGILADLVDSRATCEWVVGIGSAKVPQADVLAKAAGIQASYQISDRIEKLFAALPA